MKRPEDLPRKILVLDDDETIREALCGQLAWAGHEVVPAASGAEALEHLRRQTFAVILSDHQMPGMSGVEVLAAARAIQPNASRILITGVGSMETVMDAVNLGEISRFLTKPWLQAELLVTVANELQRYQLLEKNELLQAETRQLNQRLASTNAELERRLAELQIQRQNLDDAHGTLKKNFDHSLELCYRIIGSFYPLLGRHTRDVVDICRRMVEQGKFTKDEKRVLDAAAWLHDIGLIGVERDILHRMYSEPDTLTQADHAVIRNHPAYGQTLAAFVDELRAVGETIRCHHERFDGKGYPDGLAGESIPWTARCLAVVAAFVGSGMSHNAALEMILRESGKSFDPEAVRLFFKVAQPTTLPRRIREIMLEELQPGMLLAKGIYSPTGILLVPEGQQLSEGTISKINNHNLSTTLAQRLLVYS